MLTQDTSIEEALKLHGGDFKTLFMLREQSNTNMIVYRPIVGKDVFDYWKNHFDELEKLLNKED